MKVRQVVFVLWVIFLNACGKSEVCESSATVEGNSPSGDTYRKEMLKIRNHFALIGMQMSAKNNQFYWNASVGCTGPGGKTRIKVTDRLYAGSISKTMVAVVVLKLVEQGKLKLEDLVSLYRPDIPNGGAITIEKLLNHTAGLVEYSEVDSFAKKVVKSPSKVWMAEELLDLVKKEKQAFFPGQRWGYSNSNYVALGLIIEKVTGKSLAESLKEFVFAPAKLTDTFYGATEDPGPLLPGFTGACTWLMCPMKGTPKVHPSAYGAAGSIISTASDIAQFSKSLFEGTLLNMASLERMKSKVEVTDSHFEEIISDYGLGLMKLRTQSRSYWGHGGDVLGFKSLFAYDEESKTSFVWMLNTQEEISFNRYLNDKILPNLF